MQIDVRLVMGCSRTNLISASWPSLICYCCVAHLCSITGLIIQFY